MNVVSVSSFNSELVEFLERFGSPFLQPWFIESARGERTLKIFAIDRDRQIVACLPVMLEKKHSLFHRGDIANWAHINGPVVHPSLSAEEKGQAVSLLLKQLSKWTSYKFVCDPEDCDEALLTAFDHAGFTRRPRKTYLRMPSDPDVMAGLNKKHRNNIKRAFENLHIVENFFTDKFAEFYNKNLINCGKFAWHSIEILSNIINAGSALDIDKHSKGKRILVVAAKSKSSEAVAAIACLLNQRRMYYWLSTRQHFYTNGCVVKGGDDAIKALLIHAIARAAELGLVFDADGVYSPGAAHLLKRLFPREMERSEFVRYAPHDPWRVTQAEINGKTVYDWVSITKSGVRSTGTARGRLASACRSLFAAGFPR